MLNSSLHASEEEVVVIVEKADAVDSKHYIIVDLPDSVQ